MSITHNKAFWAVIPAAGVGKRMGSHLPKQYLPLAGKTVLEQTLDVFFSHPDISGVILAVSEDDPCWQEISSRYQDLGKPVLQVSGGRERCFSVLNALIELQLHIDSNNWVLVHDAARPCLLKSDIDNLIEQLAHTEQGGLLGLPMADTVKRCNADNEVLQTVDRSELWRALTPQMFPLGLLKTALEQAIQNNELVTDEASAIELLGLKPLMVEGQPGNIKITHPADLQLAEQFFLHQTGE